MAQRCAGGGGFVQLGRRRHPDPSMEQVKIQDGSGLVDRRSSKPASAVRLIVVAIRRGNHDGLQPVAESVIRAGDELRCWAGRKA
jgi:uncharacterized protein with PhoU and TrkA domain